VQIRAQRGRFGAGVSFPAQGDAGGRGKVDVGYAIARLWFR